MQDNYIGDIGDYGKYGLLRTVCAEGLSLAVNWYRVMPKKTGKQDDGKFINYLSKHQCYREYDPELFDRLHKIVLLDKDRCLERIERENMFDAVYFSDEVCADRAGWHCRALEITKAADVVFLDPDNGLETEKMFLTGSATDKHVRWMELKDYYARGQNVVLYQHRPQMMTKERCIENIMQYQKNFLLADHVMLLEFPKYTNRFYFMFLHDNAKNSFEKVCRSMVKNWWKNDFCREIVLE